MSSTHGGKTVPCVCPALRLFIFRHMQPRIAACSGGGRTNKSRLCLGRQSTIVDTLPADLGAAFLGRFINKACVSWMGKWLRHGVELSKLLESDAQEGLPANASAGSASVEEARMSEFAERLAADLLASPTDADFATLEDDPTFIDAEGVLHLLYLTQPSPARLTAAAATAAASASPARQPHTLPFTVPAATVASSLDFTGGVAGGASPSWGEGSSSGDEDWFSHWAQLPAAAREGLLPVTPPSSGRHQQAVPRLHDLLTMHLRPHEQGAAPSVLAASAVSASSAAACSGGASGFAGAGRAASSSGSGGSRALASLLPAEQGGGAVGPAGPCWLAAAGGSYERPLSPTSTVLQQAQSELEAAVPGLPSLVTKSGRGMGTYVVFVPPLSRQQKVALGGEDEVQRCLQGVARRVAEAIAQEQLKDAADCRDLPQLAALELAADVEVLAAMSPEARRRATFLHRAIQACQVSDACGWAARRRGRGGGTGVEGWPRRDHHPVADIAGEDVRPHRPWHARDHPAGGLAEDLRGPAAGPQRRPH